MAAKSKRDCEACGKQRRYSVADSYRYIESGLDNVILRNVDIVECACGGRVVLRAVPTLLRIVAACFAYKPARLKGREVRFVRSVLGRSKDFADAISVTPEHLSRVENGQDTVSPAMDKIVRLRFVLELLKVDGLAQLFDIDELQTIIDKKLPTDDAGLALYLTYRGPHIGASDEPVEFEFREAA
jgi:transcriptional regulator with XRE-family HTH domain